MNPSTPFIRRPVATTLLTFGLAAAGAVAFFKLPVSPLPQVDFPTISVQATLPGASPEDVATTVASPLERHLGQIADVTEMTSSSTVGSTRITLQFGLNRDINGAARDVQAAINAARADLPTSLRTNPTYRKVNPADAPIMVLTLTSDTATRGEVYDAASTVLAQKLSQVEGIGEVGVSGSSLPAVRVDLLPQALYKYGIGLEDVRAALSSANAHSPKGGIDVGDQRYQIYANDQANKADDYKSLIVAYRNGAAVHLTDVGEVTDGVENLRNAGLANGKPAVLIILYRQPGANIISTVDAVKALLPVLRASISPAIDIGIGVDRSTTIRTSLRDVERTLILAVLLVIVVVFAFLRNLRATLIPVVAVSVSLVATFGAMYLAGYSLDNLSLMALTVATGFVVDDAIVVLENVTRYIEEGMSPLNAALKGANEVGFTVLSMSISLIAVFIPILLMSGIIGRLFREFAMVISISIMISLAISLATTPMMCAVLLRQETGSHGRLYRVSERFFEAMLGFYRRTLTSALEHPFSIVLIFFAAIGLNVYLYVVIPKGFFPQQDTGRIIGSIQADQAISFQLMQQKLAQFVSIIKKDPAVETVVGFTGGGQTNSGFMFVSLVPLGERNISADGVIARLRREMAVVPGATLFLQAVQDIRAGGRASNAQYQYTLQGPTFEELNEWAPKIAAALQREPNLADVNSDQQNKGLESDVTIVRHHREPDRQHALRRVRPAPGFDHLCRAQPVSRHHGGGAAILAESGDAERRLCLDLRRIGRRIAIDQCSGGHGGLVKHVDRLGRRQRAGRAQPRDQLHRPDRQGRGVDGLGCLDQAGDDDPAVGGSLFHAGRNPACGEPSGAPGGDHDLLQPAAQRLAEHGDCHHRRHHEQARRAGDDPRHLSGYGEGVSGFAGQPALPHSRGAGHDLHRARRALRELHSPAHHPVDAALRRCRRAAGADGVQDRVQHHGADRRHSSDRHREEERDHDDRFCA
jgi:multidrug efflux pump